MADAPISFADSLVTLVPPWLRRTIGGPFLLGLGDELDVVRDLTAEASDARFPRATRPTALAPIGLDRRILRAPGETDANYATRLRRCFTFWDASGKEAGIVAAFAAAGLVALVVENQATANAFGHWARFAIYADGTGVFSAPPTWDSFDWDDGTRWDFTASDGALVDYLAAVIKLLKPAHTRCIGLVIARDGHPTVIVPIDPTPVDPPLFPIGLMPGYLDAYFDFYLG